MANGENNGEHWAAQAATVGHLIIAVAVMVGGVVVFAMAQEGRVTRLEVKQDGYGERIDALEKLVNSNGRERMSELERINEKLTQLLIANAQQHPPQLKVTTGPPQP